MVRYLRNFWAQEIPAQNRSLIKKSKMEYEDFFEKLRISPKNDATVRYRAYSLIVKTNAYSYTFEYFSMRLYS